MCDYCENQKNLISNTQMRQCSIESYCGSIERNKLTVSMIIQNELTPFYASATIECDYCPKCGRKLVE